MRALISKLALHSLSIALYLITVLLCTVRLYLKPGLMLLLLWDYDSLCWPRRPQPQLGPISAPTQPQLTGQRYGHEKHSLSRNQGGCRPRQLLGAKNVTSMFVEVKIRCRTETADPCIDYSVLILHHGFISSFTSVTFQLQLFVPSPHS